MADYVPPQVPPNHAQVNQINKTVAEVARNLKKDRHLGGLWKNWTCETIRERGEAYIDGSRRVFDECQPWMPPNDRKVAKAKFKLARDAMILLDENRASRRLKIKEVKNAKRLCKESYQESKRASDRALDPSILGVFGETYPPAGAPPPPPEESGGTGPSAGASPGTPEELDGLPPRESFTDSHAAVTSSIDESIEDIETTLPSGAAGIEAPVVCDDASSYSFFYDPSLAASGTSIASYKTERTVNSRKSRYSVLPRHKYADHGYLRPQCPESLGDTSVPKTELRDEDLDVDDEPPSSPHSAPPNSPELSPETLPLDGPADTEHVHEEAPSPPLSPNRAFAVFNCDSD